MKVFNPLSKEVPNPLIIGYKAYNLWYYKMNHTPRFIVLTYNAFDGVQIDEDAFSEVLKFAKKSKKKFAVRSSGILEDSQESSFAGINETFLNVDVDNLLEKIIACFNSNKSLRAISFRNQLGKSEEDAKISVIIQEMIDADFSGVINTINPLINDPETLLISVVKGKGEDLVSGMINSTDYFIKGDETKVVGDDILSKKLISKVKQLALKLCNKSDKFLDIEFCIKDNIVYFLQARPIIPYVKYNTKGKKIIYDNSNIVESYSHTTTPLTGSFASSMYKSVYTETLKLAKINDKIITKLSPALNNMVSYYQSRMYYNLNSWYTLNAMFPFKSSKESMERMMGVDASSKMDIVKLNVFQTLNIGIIFLKKLKSLKADSENFLKKFDEIVKPKQLYTFKFETLKEIKDYYYTLENEILKYFTIPVINDCACMFAVNKVERKLKKLKMSDYKEQTSAYVAHLGNVISSRAPEYLNKILKIIKEDDEILNDFNTLDETTLYHKYYEDPILKEAISEYLYTFGSRVSDELKLETVTFTQDPVKLFKLLKDYLQSNYEPNPNNYRFNEDERVKKEVEKAKYYIKNRERLRMLRSYVFDCVRMMFNRIGEIFVSLKMIQQKEDIFYFTIDEIFKIIDDEDYSSKLPLVKERKEKFIKDSSYQLGRRIVLFDEEPLYIKDNDTITNGIGSGNGIVSGLVVVTDKPDIATCTGKIVVTYRTDPGWTIIFPFIKGLIVERGSILSHSAVVSREQHIPSVVGVANICQTLKTNDLVILDSNQGKVVKIYE